MAQYADIIEIVAPSQALPSDPVSITVKVKNLYSATIGIMVVGALEHGVTPWPGISFPMSSANVNAGATYPFNGNFTMPDKAITIHAYRYWYGADGYWHFDDEMAKAVNRV
ncbi:hypothetical protein ACFLUS_01750 [Chloroflexota bacterium]